MLLKVTITWDNWSIESFRTLKNNVKEDDLVVVVEDGGVKKMFSKRYIRRFDVIEES